MDKIKIDDNHFSEQITYSVKLENINIAEIYDNRIIHLAPYMGVGVDLLNVNFAYINRDDVIQYCEKGVLAEASNVFLDNGTSISDCQIGVNYVNNSMADYMLSVGRCRCAQIINCDVGVQGENIVLDIDQIEHQFECNNGSIYPNRFDGNTKVFDLCYTDLSFPPTNAIMMRANYWGGQSLNNYSYGIKHTLSGCSSQVNMNIDDEGYMTGSIPPPPCYYVQSPPYPPTPQYPPVVIDQVRCEVLDGGSIVDVHTQSQFAYESLYNENYLEARTRYMPVADLDRLSNSNDRCVYKINVARCMVDAVDTDQYATQYSSWLDGSVRPDPFSDGGIAVYPNPAKNAFTIESQEERVYFTRIYNIYGQAIDAFEFTKQKTIEIGHMEGGVYLLEVRDSEGNPVQTKKLIVE